MKEYINIYGLDPKEKIEVSLRTPEDVASFLMGFPNEKSQYGEVFGYVKGGTWSRIFFGSKYVFEVDSLRQEEPRVREMAQEILYQYLRERMKEIPDTKTWAAAVPLLHNDTIYETRPDDSIVTIKVKAFAPWLDIKEAVKKAAKDFCDTPEGLRALGNAHGVLTLLDFVRATNPMFTVKYGFRFGELSIRKETFSGPLVAA